MEQHIVAHRGIREPRERGFLLVLFGLSLTTLLLMAAPAPGPWFDEFWTRFFSDPTVGLLDALKTRWVADLHPPLFSYLQWLSAHVYRLPLEQARRLNIIPLAILTIYLVLLGKAEPRHRPFIAILSISIGSCSFFMAYFAELRSYFTGACALTALTATLVVQDRHMREGARTSAALLWCGYAIALAVCLNIHYMTAAMTTVLVAIFGIAALIGGDRRRFLAYLISGIVASAPLVAFFFYQRDMFRLMTQDYWLKVDMETAAYVIAAAVAAPFARVHGLIAAIWLVSIILVFRSKTRPRLDPSAAILLFALIIEIALAFADGWATGAIILRYLIPISVLSAGTLAAALSSPIYETRWLFVVFIAGCLLSAATASMDRWKDPRWDEAAQFLSIRQKACSGARIVPMQQKLNDPTPNTVQNYNEAYAYMAAKWGLTLGNVDQPSPRPRDPACPDYYWADHYFGAGKSNARLLAEFAERWPALQGCQITAKAFKSGSAVFEVTGDAPVCNR